MLITIFMIMVVVAIVAKISSILYWIILSILGITILAMNNNSSDCIQNTQSVNSNKNITQAFKFISFLLIIMIVATICTYIFGNHSVGMEYQHSSNMRSFMHDSVELAQIIIILIKATTCIFCIWVVFLIAKIVRKSRAY